MFRRKPRWIWIIPVIVVLPIAWYLASPAFISRPVQESFPTPAETAAGPAQATEPSGAAPEGAMGGAVLLAHGSFYPVVHEGEGRAGVYLFPDGRRILRFESFHVLNGPDLHVWLVPVDPVPDTIGADIAGYFDLGSLKGSVGDQNYDLPPDLHLASFRSVVIWCQPFRVPFAAAPLAAP